MSVLSCIRPSLVRGTSNLSSYSKKITPQHVQQVVRRHMGGETPKMIVAPSKAIYNTLKDELHFFFFLGAIPAVLIVTAWNILGGRGELTDIPEGYQPHYWEYEKRPISRFIIQHVSRPFEKRYEQNMHFQWLDGETVKRRMLAKKIKNMMRERHDYKAWYYVPQDKNYVDKSKLNADEYKEKGSSF